MLNAGESAIAGSGPVGTLMESAQKGNPLAMVYPTDGTVLIIAPSSVMRAASIPMPRGCSWNSCWARAPSRIWVEHFNESIRPEVSAPAGVKSAKDVKIIRPTVEQITKDIPQLIRQWRETFGV